jgi:hypothetical protein
MKTAINTYENMKPQLFCRKYKVDPRRSVLELGDVIKPETVIGFCRDDGQPIQAGLMGQVVKIDFNHLNSTMKLTIYRGRK